MDIAMRKTIEQLQNSDKPLVCLTAYTAPMAQIIDQHCDLILVGDSLSMVLYGEDSTQKATMEMMIAHGRAVTRATQSAFIVVDMPYGSYEDSKETALSNAKTIMRETKCDAVKLEGGSAQTDTIAHLTQNNIPVMGHIGLLPQSVNDVSGYKVQGRELEAAKQLMDDAKAVEAAGAFSVVIEAVPEPLAAAITGAASIPTIGIGASSACDGQILVSEDMLGFSQGRVPKFVKQYADIYNVMDEAIKAYADEVRTCDFPAQEFTYKEVKKKSA